MLDATGFPRARDDGYLVGGQWSPIVAPAEAGAQWLECDASSALADRLGERTGTAAVVAAADPARRQAAASTASVGAAARTAATQRDSAIQRARSAAGIGLLIR